MFWIATATAYLVVAVAVALMVGRAIRLADQRQASSDPDLDCSAECELGCATC